MEEEERRFTFLTFFSFKGLHKNEGRFFIPFLHKTQAISLRHAEEKKSF